LPARITVILAASASTWVPQERDDAPVRGFTLTAVAVLVVIALGVVGLDRSGIAQYIPLASNGDGYLSAGPGAVIWLTIRGSGSRLSGEGIVWENGGQCGDVKDVFALCSKRSSLSFVRTDNQLVSDATPWGAATTWVIRPDALDEITPGATPSVVVFAGVSFAEYRRASALYAALLAVMRRCRPSPSSRHSAPVIKRCNSDYQRALEALSRVPGFL
jgi:hypothetical protein